MRVLSVFIDVCWDQSPLCFEIERIWNGRVAINSGRESENWIECQNEWECLLFKGEVAFFWLTLTDFDFDVTLPQIYIEMHFLFGPNGNLDYF